MPATANTRRPQGRLAAMLAIAVVAYAMAHPHAWSVWLHPVVITTRPGTIWINRSAPARVILTAARNTNDIKALLGEVAYHSPGVNIYELTPPPGTATRTPSATKSLPHRRAKEIRPEGHEHAVVYSSVANGRVLEIVFDVDF